MKLISESELRKLLIDSECLRRLESGGVDNWEWYGESLSENETFGKDFSTWIDVDLDGVLADYPSYTFIDDNFNDE